ncbi:MAG TPA: Ig-like domain-containing protein [Vicinamibacterales bacterium]|nr:Ig-like domain-containing protein [Vicinamibacterales bacterium]
MNKWMKVCTRGASAASLGLIGVATPVMAADIYVGPGGSLQSAINAAQPGDRILLEPGATYTGNFVLPNKGASEQYITIRSAAPDAVLPPDGVRVTPADAPNLPRIQSPNVSPALSTAPGAHHWRLQWLEFAHNDRGYNDIIALGSDSQTTLDSVPHHIILDRVYVHGHPVIGQKRGITLNSGATWVLNSYIADIKGVGFDTAGIGGWNGPGPWIVIHNYIEAAGENIIVGGADPRIQNLVPSDLEFSRNHLRKPVAWRSPILATPSNISVSAGTGGSLPAGTYSYRIVAALKTAQDAMAYSSRSAEATVTVSSGGRVSLTWPPVPNATGYRVYRGSAPGAQDRCFATSTPSFIDDGTLAGTADTGAWVSASRWTVKNLFELKSAQRVKVDGNVMENNWVHAQSGYAVLFTPRNQDGRAPWTVVRDVEFTNNLVRHSSNGVNILGYDNLQPSQQTRRITIRNNVFEDISGTHWGGHGIFVQLGDEPRDIVIDHNTVVHTHAVIWAYGGTSSSPRQILGVTITNNLFRHNSPGIAGDGRAPGNDTINTYLPDAVVLRNTFAGGKASSYPADNEFPSVSTWQSQFVDFLGSDYRLVPGSPYIGTATDGSNLGADIDAVIARTSVALSGREPRDSGVIPVSILTSTLPTAAVRAVYSAQLSAAGGNGAFVWSVQAGVLPSGLALDASTGVIGGVPTTAGVYSFTVAAADATDASNAAFAELQLPVAGSAPQVALTSPLPGATITGTSVPLQATASDADGIVARVDFFVGSMLVAASTSSPWTAVWTGATPGSHELRAVATDNDGLATTSVPASITVEAEQPELPPPPPSAPPVARPAGEIVLWAAHVTRAAGSWTFVSDAAAAGGVKLSTPDEGWNSMIDTGVDAPHASPANFFEAAFDAPAGVEYQVWVRLRAIGNGKSSDSVWVQFSDAVTAGGAPLYRVGTTDGLLVNLESCSGCGSSGWGWKSGSFWITPSYVRFPQGGTHVIRIQPREDGVEVDQIVLTPVSAAAPAPGPDRDDNTILAASPLPSADVVLYASDFAAHDVHGHWSLVANNGSPDHVSLRSQDGKFQTAQPQASPANHAEVTFAAAAGQPYRVWLRLKAAKNSTSSDAVWLQFSDSVSGSTPVYRIGTTGGFGVALQTSESIKPINWGWTGSANGLVQPPAVTFAWSGLHRLRIQTWEDGVEVDQIVLSPVRYFDEAPGAQKNDATTVAKQ